MRALVLLGGLLLVLFGLLTWRALAPSAPPPSVLEEDPTAAIVTVALAEDHEGEAAAPEAEPAPASAKETGPAAAPAAPAAAAPAAARPTAGRTRTVRKGESLYGIVREAYGTANADLVRAVALANGLADPSRLASGQELRLPSVPGYPAPR